MTRILFDIARGATLGFLVLLFVLLVTVYVS
jgi:hypothetical protein